MIKNIRMYRRRGNSGFGLIILVMLIAMSLTAVWGWTIERLAYRPLRGSFRLAPLITAIGMSILLQNFVQLVQGARVKPLPPIITGGYALFEKNGYVVQLSNIQIIVILTTIILMAVLSLGMGLVAAIAPALNVARRSVVSTLRQV